MGLRKSMDLEIISVQEQVAILESGVSSLGFTQMKETINNVAWTCSNLVKEHNSLMVIVNDCMDSLKNGNQEYEVDGMNEKGYENEREENERFELHEITHSSNNLEDMFIENTRSILQNKFYLLYLMEEKEARKNEKEEVNKSINVLKEQVS